MADRGGDGVGAADADGLIQVAHGSYRLRTGDGANLTGMSWKKLGGVSLVDILCPCRNHPRQFPDCAARITREMNKADDTQTKRKNKNLEFFVRNGLMLTPWVLGPRLSLLRHKPHIHVLTERETKLACTRTADQAQL